MVLLPTSYPASSSAIIHSIICSIKGLSFGSKDYTKELKTVECTSFLGETNSDRAVGCPI